ERREGDLQLVVENRLARFLQHHRGLVGIETGLAAPCLAERVDNLGTAAQVAVSELVPERLDEIAGVENLACMLGAVRGGQRLAKHQRNAFAKLIIRTIADREGGEVAVEQGDVRRVGCCAAVPVEQTAQQRCSGFAVASEKNVL